jgi:NADPH:quinone reductase-like Zn-dependent oxidoreductase
LEKVLEIKDLEQPVPKDNEVVLRVRAASVNPLDWRMKSQRPGVDVAGQVVAVGGAVTQFKTGDIVELKSGGPKMQFDVRHHFREPLIPYCGQIVAAS